jgi:tRNA A37 threonylcarbamoyltransferase TsaD
MKLRELLLENPFLKKGGYDTVSFSGVKNAVEKFIRANYRGDGGLALKTIDDVASSIEKSMNSSVDSLKRFEEKYNNSMSKWVAANESRIKSLVQDNI